MIASITRGITIRGKVQGVFFRKYTQKAALETGVNGFVRNCSDGSVYAEVTGSEENVERFISWCHKGSPASVVKEVVVEKKNTVHFTSFDIRY